MRASGRHMPLCAALGDRVQKGFIVGNMEEYTVVREHMAVREDDEGRIDHRLVRQSSIVIKAQ
ncbi:hypothetical protein FOPG_18865, partial [Fusarium oxysporum f. sp. conglutinans race 2 54008]